MSDLSANVKILIFSRPEQSITAKIPLYIKRLDLSTKDSEDGVDRLVHDKLRELPEFREWNDWPSKYQARLLCRHAAGHLGWAMAAIRWIASELHFIFLLLALESIYTVPGIHSHNFLWSSLRPNLRLNMKTEDRVWLLYGAHHLVVAYFGT